MILIKMEDNGPVFYKHSRVMESGKKFNCLKFRTMHVNAHQRLKGLFEKNPALRDEWERTYKLKNDPRVTRVGKFLRKTSLDELPQFLNVLAGHMSVVGARPVVPEELDKYYKESALTYCATKPGITGLWQTGKRSDTVNYHERVALDRWYVSNCSSWLDIKIIFKTIRSMVKTKGAY
jgi:lipopolysaccharide/colanic/teichoic acid biosynthesis glycosyltransferase